MADDFTHADGPEEGAECAARLPSVGPHPLVLDLVPDEIRRIEPYIRQAARQSGVADRQLARFVFAVNEVAEAVIILAAELHIRGQLRILAHPYTGWVTASLTFPDTIPLDPISDAEDPTLTEMPGLGLMPDIFWRRIVRQWVDKAQWTRSPRETTITLSQYPRRHDLAGELYFLGLTPRPVSGLKVDPLDGDLAIAVCGSTRSAFQLSAEAAFLLASVDGRTPVREIYRAMADRFGLIHPRRVGRMVEDLSRKGLIICGDSLLATPTGRRSAVRKALQYVLSLQYSFPLPDPFFSRLDALAGAVWSPGGFRLGSLFLVLSLAAGVPALWSEPEAVSRALQHFSRQPRLWIPFYFVMVGCVLLHELSHAMTCKHAGGRIHTCGIMFYYGMISVFVDTTDSWRLPRARRILVSLAGPFTDLCAAGALLCLFRVLPPDAGPVRDVLLVLTLFLALTALMNLNPFLETDGYYMLLDALGLVSLRPRAIRSLGDLLLAFRHKTTRGLQFLRTHFGLVWFGILSAAMTTLLLAASAYMAFFGSGFPPAARFLVFALTLLSLSNRFLQAAINHYRRSRMTVIDLKGL